jgi:hypothetical protein
MTSIILMPLLNEGTPVWRPVEADALGDGCYRITGQAPDDEEWAFPRGALVIVDHVGRIVSCAAP